MSLPSRAVKAHHTCKFSRPVLPKLHSGQAFRRQNLTATQARAVADDQENGAPTRTWARAVNFMKEQAPKFMAAMMVAAMLVRAYVIPIVPRGPGPETRVAHSFIFRALVKPWVHAFTI